MNIESDKMALSDYIFGMILITVGLIIYLFVKQLRLSLVSLNFSISLRPATRKTLISIGFISFVGFFESH